ncbi:MAG: hypothetical protein IPP37_17295 [Saprospiraceae bacterium]|nr:hypothetical protein [Saprospiraceae bacterium]
MEYLVEDEVLMVLDRIKNDSLVRRQFLYYHTPGIPDGGILSFENADPVVEINGTEYSSINDAIDASAPNDTLIITSDVCENISASLPDGVILIIPSQYKS